VLTDRGVTIIRIQRNHLRTGEAPCSKYCSTHQLLTVTALMAHRPRWRKVNLRGGRCGARDGQPRVLRRTFACGGEAHGTPMSTAHRWKGP